MTDLNPEELRRKADKVMEEVQRNIATLTERIGNHIDEEARTHHRQEVKMSALEESVTEVTNQLIELNAQLSVISMQDHISDHYFIREFAKKLEAETKKKESLSMYLTQQRIKLTTSTVIGALVIMAGVAWVLFKFWLNSEGVEIPT